MWRVRPNTALPRIPERNQEPGTANRTANPNLEPGTWNVEPSPCQLQHLVDDDSRRVRLRERPRGRAHTLPPLGIARQREDAVREPVAGQILLLQHHRGTAAHQRL